MITNVVDDNDSDVDYGEVHDKVDDDNGDDDDDDDDDDDYDDDGHDEDNNDENDGEGVYGRFMSQPS